MKQNTQFLRAIPRAFVAATAAAVLATLAPGGASAIEAGRACPLLIAAAASLREPVQAIARQHQRARPGASVAVTFGASSSLAAQVRAGAPVDVLLSADQQIVRALQEEGLIAPGTAHTFASNRIVLVAGTEVAIAAGQSAAEILGSTPGRIALPGSAVPLGRYARQWLAMIGTGDDRYSERFVVTEHARATLAAVENGGAALAIVYMTDARQARRAVVAAEIAESDQPRIAYSAARIARGASEACVSEAAGFLERLGGTQAMRELEDAGFRAPPPAGQET